MAPKHAAYSGEYIMILVSESFTKTLSYFVIDRFHSISLCLLWLCVFCHVKMIRTSKKENATPSPVHDKPRRRKTGNSSILVSSTSPHASPAVSQASSSNDSGQSTVGGADGPRQPVASAAATSNGNGAAVSTDGGSSNRANDSDSDDEDVPATGTLNYFRMLFPLYGLYGWG